MRMFLGEYSPNLTEGSRIVLPKKFRDQISDDDIVLSKGFEKCIFVYDKEDWAERVQKQVENSTGNINRSDLERYIYTSATEVAIDVQGRLVLPQHLKDYSEISLKTAIVGVGDHIEIWDQDKWNKHMEKVSVQLEL